MLKKIKIWGIISLTLFMNFQSCFVSHASALPNTPPTLELVKPQLEVVRGNAYQYALEQSGYDVQNGVNSLAVLTAIDTACKASDYAFSSDDDYQATIQVVNDRSGLPEALQGFNAELYFAKINYLDMQLGIYIDEQGQIIGDALENAVVEFTSEADAVIDTCKGYIQNNILGQLNTESLGLESDAIVKNGFMTNLAGVQNATYYWENYTGNSPYYTCTFMTPVVSDNSYIFVASSKGYYQYMFVISPTSAGRPSYKGIADVDYSTYDSMNNAISTALDKKSGIFASCTTYGSWTVWQTCINNRTSSKYLGQWAQNTPYLVVDWDAYGGYWGLVDWLKNSYLPRIDTDADPCVGMIALNPNGLANPVGGTAYNARQIAEHNQTVTETVPEIAPSISPVPDGQPLYDPVSPTAPQVEPAVFPELDPVTNPVVYPVSDPVPNPDPEPSTEPSEETDTGKTLMPLEGLADKFPFCVPFDLIDAFKGMVKEPEIPKWEFTITIPHTNYSADFVIDLAPFSNIAKLSRILLLIMYIIVLIVATRRLISN